MTQIHPDADDIALLRAALAANDVPPQLWPPESVQYARRMFQRARGTVSSIEQVIQEVGPERAEQLTPQIVEQRKFKNALLGYGSSCHYCSSEAD